MGLPDNTYRIWLLANPKAFVEGARGFCKQAEADGRTTWDRIRPWLLGLALGYGGLKGGEWWGRYAQSRGYREGPVKGPLVAFLNGVLPKRLDVRQQTQQTQQGQGG